MSVGIATDYYLDGRASILHSVQISFAAHPFSIQRVHGDLSQWGKRHGNEADYSPQATAEKCQELWNYT